MTAGKEFLILDVFARRRFEGNQLAVFPDAAGIDDNEMQTLARETHFSETTFVLSDQPGPKGWPVRIFTPAREVPFAGHPTLGTAWTIWDQLLGRRAEQVVLDLRVGSVPVDIGGDGRLTMSQAPPEFGTVIPPEEAAAVLGLGVDDIDTRFPSEEVSTGLGFVIVPVRTIAAMRRIAVNRPRHDALVGRLRSKAVLAFCPQAVNADCALHVRVFCPYYDVPEDPATGSANGCLCAWLVKHRYFGQPAVRVASEQGMEMGRPAQLFLVGAARLGAIQVRVGGSVVPVARCRIVDG